MSERVRGDEMTKRVFNRFDPFMPVKLDSKASEFNVVENNSVDVFEDFSNITLNESLKFRTPQVKKGFTISKK